MNLSFSGCGFLGVYHLGVAKTLSREGKTFINQIQRYGGASAGALIASLFAVHGPNEEIVERCRQFSTDLAKEMNSKTFGVFTPGVELLKPVERFMEALFPEDAHLRANGKLFISVTNADTKENELISHFSSRDNLIQFLLASSCIPLITSSASVTIEGKKYCDGGLTDNLPTFPEGETIKVSPFEGKHDISPSISAIVSGSSVDFDGAHFTVANQTFKVSMDNLTRGVHIFAPPSVAVLTSYYQQGSKDALKFLVDRGYFTPENDPSGDVESEKSSPDRKKSPQTPDPIASCRNTSRLMEGLQMFSFHKIARKFRSRESSVDGKKSNVDSQLD